MLAPKSPDPQDLNAAVLKLGQEIWSEMKGEIPGIFNKDFWQGKILEWAMKDPSFRTDLFRLVDVLPVLKSRKQIWQHMRDYLIREGRELPAVLGIALKAASGGLTGMVAVEVIRRNVMKMAENFILGHDAAEAIPLLRKLHGQGIGFTADLLGEATLNEAEAVVYSNRYRDLINSLSAEVIHWPSDPILSVGSTGPIPIANVSLKLSALEGRLDPVNTKNSVTRLKDRVLPLFLLAKKQNVFLNVDLESWNMHGITYDLFEELLAHPELRTWPHLGIVVQAYLKEAPKDVARLLSLAKSRGAPITVRLVKGAYWDYEVSMADQWGLPCPVLTRKAETDAQYERLSYELLKAHEHLSPAFGSHNLRSLVYALVAADELKVPRNAYEIQMLFGMAEPERKILRARNHRLRLYAPVGALLPGMAYLVRRLLENTSNSGFLRQSHHEGENIAALLASPPTSTPPTPTRSSPTKGELTSPFRNCSRSDFTKPEIREAFAQAIETWRIHFPVTVPIVLNGKVEKTAKFQDGFSPNNCTLSVSRMALATPDQADAAATIIEKSYPHWRDQPLKSRTVLLEALADILENDRIRLAALQCLEVAKPWQEADLDVAEAVDFCRYYARQAFIELEPRTQGQVPGELNTLFYQGRGPAVIIAPWNFPLAILTGMAVAALVAGNPVILKPAEQSSVMAYELYIAMRKAGFPPEVVQFLPGLGEEVGASLVSHPLIALIAFTGSLQVGATILREAALLREGQPWFKHVVCEMGGKNAIIIDDDADLDEAVTGVLRSAFGFAGQKCSACSRLIVVGDIYSNFLERMVAACQDLAVTTAESPSCDVGPVIDRDSQARLEAIVLKPGDGATLLFKGNAPAGGTFVAPVLFEVQDAKHRLMQDELFGPILTVMKAKDFEDALNIVAATPFALTGSVFTRSPGNIESARARFRVGNLYINRGSTGALVARQPFGGFGHSGLGTKAGGPGYLSHFVDPYCITENTMRHGFTPEIES